MEGFGLFAIAVLALSIFILFSTIKIVPQGFQMTVERFGKYVRTLKPGLHLLAPFIDRIGRRLNMMEQVLDIPAQEVITRDNVMVSSDAIAFIQIMDAAAAAYEVSNLSSAISNLAMTNIRTVIGSLDLDQVLSNRDDINERLLRVIDAATQPWGVKVTRAEILTAEGEKQSAILRAEGEKQAAILEAEGRREAAFRDAEAREREAQAEAKATEVVSDAIARGDVNAINYFVAQKYVAAFEKLAMSPQQKTVIVPAEMSALVASIAGVGALARDAFAQSREPAPSVPPSR